MCLYQIDRAYLYALDASTHQDCGTYQKRDIYCIIYNNNIYIIYDSVFSEGHIVSIIRLSPVRQARFEVSKLGV